MLRWASGKVLEGIRRGLINGMCREHWVIPEFANVFHCDWAICVWKLVPIEVRFLPSYLHWENGNTISFDVKFPQSLRKTIISWIIKLLRGWKKISFCFTGTDTKVTIASFLQQLIFKKREVKAYGRGVGGGENLSKLWSCWRKLRLSWSRLIILNFYFMYKLV